MAWAGSEEKRPVQTAWWWWWVTCVHARKEDFSQHGGDVCLGWAVRFWGHSEGGHACSILIIVVSGGQACCWLPCYCCVVSQRESRKEKQRHRRGMAWWCWAVDWPRLVGGRGFKAATCELRGRRLWRDFPILCSHF